VTDAGGAGVTEAGGASVSDAAAAPSVHRWTRASRVFVSGSGLLLVLLAFIPFAFTQNTTEKLTELFVLIIIAAMWNVLAGYAGLVSVGQQAFIGIGAYGTIVFADQGMNPFLGAILAALVAGVISLPVSLLVFRLRGGQFAIGMWVVAEVFRLLVTNDQSIGGGTGRSLIGLNVYDPATRQAYTYWVALAFMGVLMVLGFVMLRSRLGSSLQAIRDDEDAAVSVGVRVTRAKRIVFLFAAVGCGAAGSVTILNTLRVQPDSIFGVQWTAYMIFMVLLGGLGTFEGPVLGALVLFFVQQQFANEGSWYLVGLGAVAIVVTLLFPRGLWGALVDRFDLRLMPVGYHVRQLAQSLGGRRGPPAGSEPEAAPAVSTERP
jgi:branched-chain amino acid transport system permease protein